MNLNLQQQFTVRASRQVVWAFLSDAPQVGKCMPGVQGVEPLGDQVYKVLLAIGIGPIQAKLGGKVTIVETYPPDRMVVRLDWKDGSTDSKVGADAEIRLEDGAQPGETKVIVQGQLSLVGPLDKYGQPIANKKAAEITETFAGNVRTLLESSAEAAGQVEVAAQPVSVSPWQRVWQAIRRLFGRRSDPGPVVGSR